MTVIDLLVAMASLCELKVQTNTFKQFRQINFKWNWSDQKGEDCDCSLVAMASLCELEVVQTGLLIWRC